MALPDNMIQSAYVQGFWKMNADGGNEPDLSGNGYTLVETSGTIPAVEGVIGNARDFELGDSEYFTIAHAACPNLQITGEIGFSIWLKPESIGVVQYIITKWGASGNRGYALYIKADGTIGFALSNDGTAQIGATSTTALQAGVLNHVGATLNQTTDLMQIYIDGLADGAAVSKTTDIYNTTGNFFVGAYYNGAVNYDGLMDELIVWNTCPTAAEMLQVKNITSWRYDKTNTGILVPIGAILKKTNKTPSGTLTFTGIAKKLISQGITGILTFAGTLSKIRIYLKTIQGIATFTGEISQKNISKVLAGELNMTGTINKVISRLVAGVLTFVAAAGKLVKVTLSFGNRCCRRTLSRCRMPGTTPSLAEPAKRNHLDAN